MADGDLRRVGRRIAQPFQLGHVPLGWILQRQLPLVSQLQDGHGREALRHRGNAEHAVAIDGRLGRHVADAGDSEMGKLAVNDDAPGSTRYVCARHELSDEAIDLRECRAQFRPAIRIGKYCGRICIGALGALGKRPWRGLHGHQHDEHETQDLAEW
jgi:hypothetical protein